MIDGRPADTPRTAVDKALAKLRDGGEAHLDRRAQIERELSLIESRLGRLVEAITNGGALDTLVAQIKAEEARKKTLASELDGVVAVAKISSLDGARLKKGLTERVAGAKELLGRNPAQARQALRKLVDDRIDVRPIEQDARRGIRLTGKGSFAKLLTGEAVPLMVVPPG